MYHKTLFWLLLLALAVEPSLMAQAPTSRTAPFNNVQTTLPPGGRQDSMGQLWDHPNSGALLFSETPSGLFDKDDSLSNFVFGSQTNYSLVPWFFLPPRRALSTLWTANDNSRRVNGQLLLTASAFTLKLGPQVQQVPQRPPRTAASLTTATVGPATLGGNYFHGDQNIDGSLFSINATGVVGVRGETRLNTTDVNVAAVIGFSNVSSGKASGLIGDTYTPDGHGVYGRHFASTGTGAGVTGDTNNSGPGVLGRNFGSGEGVHGEGPNLGVRGIATAGGNTVGVAGTSSSGIGIRGEATAVTGGTIGVSGVVNSSGGTAAMLDNLSGGGHLLVGRRQLVNVFSVDSNGTVSTKGDISTDGGNVVTARKGTAGGNVIAGGDVISSHRVIAAGGFAGRCQIWHVSSVVGGPITCDQMDFAETFSTLEPTEPGDVVVLVNRPASAPSVRRSARSYETPLLGVVATNPGLVLDKSEAHLSGDNTHFITPEKTVVGLVGRVPVKVSLESGPIAVGDPLTSSSVAGVAMKATRVAQIVGYALQNAVRPGKILVHLQPGYYIPPEMLVVLNQQDSLDGLKTRQAEKAEIEKLKAQVARLRNLLETKSSLTHPESTPARDP